MDQKDESSLELSHMWSYFFEDATQIAEANAELSRLKDELAQNYRCMSRLLDDIENLKITVSGQQFKEIEGLSKLITEYEPVLQPETVDLRRQQEEETVELENKLQQKKEKVLATRDKILVVTAYYEKLLDCRIEYEAPNTFVFFFKKKSKTNNEVDPDCWVKMSSSDENLTAWEVQGMGRDPSEVEKLVEVLKRSKDVIPFITQVRNLFKNSSASS